MFFPQSPWHNFPFFPLLFSGSPSRLWDSRAVQAPACRRARALGRGKGGTIKKLDTGRRACRSGESPGLGSFPFPDHRGSSREPQWHQAPQTCPTTQPPGKREGGRARQERQNPAFDQPPSTTHYASKRKDQGTCFLTENKKNMSSKTFSCENNPFRGQLAFWLRPHGRLRFLPTFFLPPKKLVKYGRRPIV